MLVSERNDWRIMSEPVVVEDQCAACRAVKNEPHVEGCRKVIFDKMREQQKDSE